MKAVVYEKPGDESVLKIGEVAEPKAGPGQLLIRVKYAGLNRADLMQRQGYYPPPPGASEIIGMECAGEVAAVGAGVTGWHVGERAMALMAGGGYAELAVVHGGGSGVGTASILLCKEAAVRLIATAGSDVKCEQCLKLGADVAINYKSGPFAAAVKTATNGRGVDVILDSIGGAYLAPNLEALAHSGRLVLIGLMKGARSEIDLAAVLRRHLKLIGSTLRTRSEKEKAQIVAALLARFGDALEAGRLRPPIYKVVPMANVAEAHRMMAASEHFGKIILRIA
jgi:NADPH:quinone reductase-like Zn-dependent oxidoreductase